MTIDSEYLYNTLKNNVGLMSLCFQRIKTLTGISLNGEYVDILKKKNEVPSTIDDLREIQVTIKQIRVYPDKSLEVLQEHLKRQERLFGKESSKLVPSLINLSKSLQWSSLDAEKRFKQCEECLKKALNIS